MEFFFDCSSPGPISRSTTSSRWRRVQGADRLAASSGWRNIQQHQLPAFMRPAKIRSPPSNYMVR